MTTELQHQLSQIRIGDHLCMLYEEPPELLPTAARFLGDGLQRGEHALYVVDDNRRENVIEALAAAGIDVDQELERGRLRLLSAREYCPLEDFDPREMLARFRELGEEMARAGTPAARAAIEMTWALTVDAPLDRLAEYECWGNHIFEHFTGISLCMYNRRRFPAGAMERLLRAHPIVVLDGEVAPNPFYEPPEISYAEEPSETRRFEWMIDRLRLASADRRDREAMALREQEARLANQAKTDFLSAMSHELRTPLNAIAGYLDLLELGIAGGLSPEQLTMVGRIKASQHHLLGLIDDLLQFARIEAGGLVYRLGTVPVLELVRGVSEILAAQADAAELEYVISGVDPDVRTRCDPERARQVLLNLVGNAIKFTPAGGRVTVACEVSDGEVALLVEDTGPGIPADRLETIFEPFVQVSLEDDGARQHGVGLGLAISRNLARAMGGDVVVESTLAVGSRFTFRLPAAPDDSLAAADAAVGAGGEERLPEVF
jgi:signal transduction histidine kinase